MIERYYVVKVTIEDTHETQKISPHDNYKSALIDFHNEFGGTLAYDTVKVCSMMLIDTYNRILEQARYERPEAEPEA